MCKTCESISKYIEQKFGHHVYPDELYLLIESSNIPDITVHESLKVHMMARLDEP